MAIVIHVIASVLVLLALSTDSVSTASANFTRLSREDNAKLQALCHNPEFAASSEFKVFNGTTVPKGKYPWAVIIQARKNTADPWSQQCGGTLISRRHVLTATHCFATFTDYYFRVLVGGVCAEVRPDEGCDRVDMVEAPMDFVAFVETLDEGPDPDAPIYAAWEANFRHDFAIIQLRDELKIQLDAPNSTTQAVCLTWPALELPTEMAVYGWGKTEKDRSSSHLLEVNMSLMTPQDPLTKEDKFCSDDKFFCQHVAESNKDGGPGDSGSGVAARIGPSVYLFGSTLSGLDDLHINVASRSQKQVVDLCYYVGNCVTRELANKSAEELVKELHYVFNKLYFPK